MKKFIKKGLLILACLRICSSLVGCTIGEYKVFDYHLDEDGNKHFMLFGQHGTNGVNAEIENETSSLEGDDIQKRHANLEGIVGTSLKRGWASSDNSILKGKNVYVKGDGVLFSINLERDREVTISYDIVLDDGAYSLVYIRPDNAEPILLQDGKIIRAEEQILFTQGQNEITILSDRAIFKEINISITGVEASDFE